MRVEMSWISSVLFLAAACAGAVAELHQYYQPPQHQGRVSQENSGYTLYLKPVLVKKAPGPLEMYLALDEKEFVVYPSAQHYQHQTYPLQYTKIQYQGDERLLHHVERPSEYEGEDENYSSSEDVPRTSQDITQDVQGHSRTTQDISDDSRSNSTYKGEELRKKPLTRVLSKVTKSLQ